MTDPTVYHLDSNSDPVLQMTDHNLLTLHAVSTHPLLSRLASRLAIVFRLSQTRYTHLQFFFHYVFHPPALACFLIGFFGLLSVELQLLALGPVQAKFSSQVASTVADFSSTIATSMNASMQNQSATYANEINGHILVVQSSINDGLFGWVNTTTTTLNTTIATFYSDIQNAVTTVFGGTILDQPIQDFVHCLLGTKVAAIEDALTFLHNNLQVNFPIVNESVLVLSPDQVNEVAQPISEAAVGGGSGNNEGLVGRLVDTYVSSLEKERIMFGIFLGLWLFVVFMASCIILWHSYGKAWAESRKRKRWESEQRDQVVPFVYPWQPSETEKRDTVLASHHPAGSVGNLPSFGPLNSPEKVGFFTRLTKSAGVFTHRTLKRTPSDATSMQEENNTRGLQERLSKLRHKSIGQEMIVADEEAVLKRQTYVPSHQTEYFEVEVREEKGRPWWQRLLQRRNSEDSFQSEGVVKTVVEPAITLPQAGSSPRRLNPQLTIQTNIGMPASQRRKLPIVVQGEEDPLATTQQVLREVIEPSVEQRRSRPLVTKPLSTIELSKPVNNSSRLSFTVKAPQNPNSNLPIHHGFVRPIPAGTPSSPSPPSSPYDYTTLAPSAPPHRVRASSQTISENPFATCFDDECDTSIGIPFRQANPFADAVGTPRAV